MSYTERYDEERQRKYWVDANGRSSWTDPYVPSHEPPRRAQPVASPMRNMTPMNIDNGNNNIPRIDLKSSSGGSTRTILTFLLVLLSVALGLYIGAATPYGTEIIKMLDLPTEITCEDDSSSTQPHSNSSSTTSTLAPTPAPTPDPDSAANQPECSKPGDGSYEAGAWDDSLNMAEAIFEEIPPVVGKGPFSLLDISSSYMYKGASVRDLVYQALYNEFFELPTELVCTPVYASFQEDPEIPPYCYFQASEFPNTNHSVLITLDPANTDTPPIISTYKPETFSTEKLESWLPSISPFRIVMPAPDAFFLQNDKGAVVDSVGNDFSEKAYMSPKWKEGSNAAKWIETNLPKEAIITTNGYTSVSNKPNKKDQIKASEMWDVVATPHFVVTLTGGGNCAVDGLDHIHGRLIVSHEGNIGALQFGEGNVKKFNDVFNGGFGSWIKTTTQSGDPERYKVHKKGIYAVPFDDIEVDCAAYTTEVESIVGDFVGQNGVSPLHRYDLFDETQLHGFKVHSETSGSTRIVYLGLGIHSHLDDSAVAKLALPPILGGLNSFPSTAREIRDHVVASDEDLYGAAFDQCFEHACKGGSCHVYAKFSQEENALRSSQSNLPTKLNICARCAALNLDGVAGATIPYIDEDGEIGHAKCDTYEAVASNGNRRQLRLWTNSDYGEWSNAISAHRFHEMPNYSQFQYNSPNGIGGTCPVGCGPVAWAMLFAWGERAWFDEHGFVASEFGEDNVALLCNDYHDGATYPFDGAQSRYWSTSCGRHWEYEDLTSANIDGVNVNPSLPQCNALDQTLATRIADIREEMGTGCFLGGGLTMPYEMNNGKDQYSSWHSAFHRQTLTTRHNGLPTNWLFGSWKDGYLRSQLRRGRPALAGFRSSFWGQHYANALQYKWRTFRKCRLGFCWTSYDYIYYINMGHGGGNNGWKSITPWLAGWIEAEADRSSEEEWVAWLLCCELDIISENGNCYI
eukprot:CAMPEP_0118649408 /NCGR_PEP_ID=MMETSP0785-20121206/9686_1 /TAXON_ID=91992 /ORGANISM="Bolidomonas pacifica, Strain CCMP 1866" /LENGTH=969 /DNA_ID=CAMNT_0006541691 /DNA_START=96 /DNA_END=3002 /DNA_ORIENTATION=-